MELDCNILVVMFLVPYGKVRVIALFSSMQFSSLKSQIINPLLVVPKIIFQLHFCIFVNYVTQFCLPNNTLSFLSSLSCSMASVSSFSLRGRSHSFCQVFVSTFRTYLDTQYRFSVVQVYMVDLSFVSTIALKEQKIILILEIV